MKIIATLFLIVVGRLASAQSVTHTLCQELIEFEKALGTSTLTIEKCQTNQLGDKNTSSYFTLVARKSGAFSTSSLAVLTAKEAELLSIQINTILNETEKESLGKGESYQVVIGKSRLYARGANYGKWEYTLDPNEESLAGSLFKLNKKDMQKLSSILIK